MRWYPSSNYIVNSSQMKRYVTIVILKPTMNIHIDYLKPYHSLYHYYRCTVGIIYKCVVYDNADASGSFATTLCQLRMRSILRHPPKASSLIRSNYTSSSTASSYVSLDHGNSGFYPDGILNFVFCNECNHSRE